MLSRTQSFVPALRNDPIMVKAKRALTHENFVNDNLLFRNVSYYSSGLLILPQCMTDAIRRYAPFAQLRNLIQTILAHRQEPSDPEERLKIENSSNILDAFIADKNLVQGVSCPKHMYWSLCLEACIFYLFGQVIPKPKIQQHICCAYRDGSDNTQTVVCTSMRIESRQSLNVPLFLQLRWALLYLAKYPELHLALQKSIDCIGMDSRPKARDLKRMLNFQTFLHEVIRYSVPLLFGLQRSTTAELKIDGSSIPQDTPVVLKTSTSFVRHYVFQFKYDSYHLFGP